jgi:hypothetical protein
VSLALDGWMRQGQEREYKEYKEYKEFKEFKEYEESANAPLGSHGLVSPYPRVAVSPYRPARPLPGPLRLISR